MNKDCDRIGVFVSIVSTKIPFKGTGKEYIGDDIEELKKSVKKALQSCGRELKVHLGKKLQAKDAKERQKKLMKYVPNISGAIFGLLESMKERRASGESGRAETEVEKGVIKEMASKTLTVKSMEEKIRRLVEEEVEKAEVGENEGKVRSEQDIFLRVMKDVEFAWEKAVEGQIGVFVPAKKLRKLGGGEK